MKQTWEKEKMNRRTFFTKSAGYTAGLSLLAFPKIITGALTAKGDKSKEKILKELEEKVVTYMPKYRSCALASFAALNDQFNLKADAATLRALMPFTGGIAGKGETCGAVSGALLALGFFFGPHDQKATAMFPPSWINGGVFMDKFKKEYGSTRCWEVQKHLYGRYFDSSKPEELKLFMEASKKNPNCFDVVKKAVLIAAEIILANS
ncbi:MAG: C-GCAxxG-C-C family protein [Candidatus Aminicenantes bacterium]|jgi:C_GCAxxG_C_C family probable redox protein